MIVYKNTEGSITDMDESQGIVKGIASRFGNVDSDGDIIVKGAYKKTITENGHRVKYLYQHRLDKPIGVMKELSESDNSLDFTAQIAIKTTLGRDAFEMIKAGVISENSVGFAPIKEKMNRETNYNEITEVKLYEVSAVTLAANPMAIIESYKSEGDSSKMKEYLSERFDALNKLVKSNITDELGLAVEFEIKALKELYTGIVDKSNAEVHLTEEEKREKEEQMLYTYLLKNL